MVPANTSLKVVKTVLGKSTGGDDDILICEDGSAWKRLDNYESDATATSQRAILRNGMVG